MSNEYTQLLQEINETFSRIVDIINEVIEHRTESFSALLEVGEKIQNDSINFVDDTDKIVNSISDGINTKIDNLNMENMRAELNMATKTFLSITEELELLSYNTICRTMALGDKGSTITHISKEIKKYSTMVKNLLDEITKEFSDIYEMFRHISDNVIKQHLAQNKNNVTFENIEQLVINSDVSDLIENSQFHDIFTQELQIIYEALSSEDASTPYNAGYTFGLFEKSVSKLDFIKVSLRDKLENIKSIMKDFIYSFNTDLQNIVSKTNILREELIRVEEISGTVCATLSSLMESTHSSSKLIVKAHSGVNNLTKHSKTFKNLVVVTAIEVARINDEDLKSVVVSMIRTEGELHELIDKLKNNLSLWQTLQHEFEATFSDAGDQLKSICDPQIKKERASMLQTTYSLDREISAFRKIFVGEKYVSYFESNTKRLVDLFDEFTVYFNNRFDNFSSSISPEFMSDELFTQGRNESELKDILASEDEQSSIEFF